MACHMERTINMDHILKRQPVFGPLTLTRVINLARRTDRRAHMETNVLGALRLRNFLFLEAVDGRGLGQETLQSVAQSLGIASPLPTRYDPNDGYPLAVSGCFLSHALLLTEFVDSWTEAATVLVLEDDVKLTADAIDALESLNAMDPDKFDAVWLHTIQSNDVWLVEVRPDSDVIRPDSAKKLDPRFKRLMGDGINPFIVGMGGILWTRRGAKRFLDMLKRMPVRPVDHYMPGVYGHLYPDYVVLVADPHVLQIRHELGSDLRV